MPTCANSKACRRALEFCAARLSDSPITITEHGLKFLVDIERGHKTGFYLDQRANRQRVRTFAKGKDVLDCFCYTGGFTVNALAGDAKSVLCVDASSEALALARQNIELNKLPLEKVQFLEGDVFQVLRKFRDEARTFDMIILDPPKFAPTAAQADKAARFSLIFVYERSIIIHEIVYICYIPF